jgi:putative phage-type endonuclease
MIKTLDLDQSTDNWRLWRSKGIGSSDIATIIGHNPFSTPYQLWLEKTGQAPPKDLSNNLLVQRGNMLEPVARQKTNSLLERDFQPILFVDTERDYMRYSSDGYDKTHCEIIEIKCTSEKNHDIAKSGNVPDYYKPQLAWGAMISKAKASYYVSYNPQDDEELVILTVDRDEKLEQLMLTEAAKFWQCIQSKTPPELTEKDYEPIDSDEYKTALEAYRQQLTKLKIQEQLTEDAKAKLLASLGNKKRVKGSGARVAEVIRSGNIQYKNIPELLGVDLEPYRSKPTSYFKITLD